MMHLCIMLYTLAYWTPVVRLLKRLSNCTLMRCAAYEKERLRTTRTDSAGHWLIHERNRGKEVGAYLI